MTTYRLRADGTNGSIGTGTSPSTTWQTPAYACANMSPGDRLEIMDAGGIYYMTSEHQFKPIGTAVDLITITAYAGQTPVFSGLGGTFGGTDAVLSIQAESRYAYIGDFYVVDCAQGNAKGRGMEVSSNVSPSKANHLTFANIVIDNVWERGFGGGGDYISLDNVEVTNFCIRNTGQAQGGGGWATGIAPYSYSNGTLPIEWDLYNCYVHEGFGEGIVTLRVTGMTIRYCRIRNAFSKSIYVDKAKDIEIYGNIVWFNDVAYQRDGRNTDGLTFAVEGTPLHSPYGVDNVKIYNNVFAGCRDGVTWFTDSADAASSYRLVKVWHNVCYALTGKSMRIENVPGGANAPSGCEAKDNIFDTTMTTLNNASAWTFDANRWDSIPAVGTHTNSFTSDPQFVAPNTTGDADGFQVQAGSPCLGAGAYIVDVPTDYYGTAYVNPTSAVGFYEPSGASPSASVSPSASRSPSASVSPSRSPSASVSPSASRSPSASQSPSVSVSPSRSPSASDSPSAGPGVTVGEAYSGASTQNLSTYNTALFDLTPGYFYLVFVHYESNNPLVTPTCKGFNVEWDEVTSVDNHTVASPTQRLTAFWGIGIDSLPNDSLEIDFTGVVQAGIEISVLEFNGLDHNAGAEGPILLSAIGNGDSATTGLVNISPLGAQRITVAGFANNVNGNIVPGSGFTELHDIGHNTPQARLQTEWLDGADATVDATFASANWAGIAIALAVLISSDSPSVSPSASTSPSASASPSASVSPSISPSASVSPSPSASASASPSVSPSVSPSTSPSASRSPSSSVSPSTSPSASRSPSASTSPSASVSPSVSPSASASPSVSPSASGSPSASDSPSAPLIEPTLVYNTGFEHGVMSANGGGLFDSVTGVPTVQGTNKRSGSYALECAPSASQVRARKIITGNVVVWRFYIRFNSLPTGQDMRLAYATGADASECRLMFDDSEDKFGIQWSGGATVPGGPVLSGATWYRVDLRINFAANPHTCEWQIDGTAGTQVDSAIAASTLAHINFGSNAGSDTYTAQYDDVAVSVTSVDYPLGEGLGIFISPSADGTHSPSTPDCIRGGGVAPALISGGNPAYQYLDDVPLPSGASPTTDRINQDTATSPHDTHYVEVAFGDINDIYQVNGATALLAYGGDSATANNGTTRIVDEDSTPTDIYSGDMSEINVFYKNAPLPNPAGGWDTGAVNALIARVGFSSDVTPNPYWQALMIEVDVTEVGSASVSPSVSPSASISPSASASPSRSPSASVSPSVSPSASASPSASPSVSPSASGSPSLSPSASRSPSASVSPSRSPSSSESASASPTPPPPPGVPQVQVYATGGVEPVYGVKVDDAFGTILFQPKNFNSVEWTRARNSVGAATLILPGHWPASKVKRKDGIVEIWKQIGSAPPFLVTNTVWLRRGWKRLIKRGSDGGLEKLWAIRCFDLNHLIARRTVDYNAANDYTSKLLPADDMIKAIARENFGSLATDTDRSWADKIDIQADRSEAPVILKTFARRNMLQIFQEICRTSDELGVHLSFDIVVKVPPGIPGQPFKVELRTYTGQIGVDHTFPSGNPPITLGAERGNLDGVEIDESYEEEVTRGIVGGQGDEEFRPIARFTDDARVAESPFGLIESFEDSQQDTDGAGLSDEARALVNANGLHKSATGQLVPTSGVIFDIDVRWGDKVTVQADSESFDAHIDVAHGVFTREGEQVDVVIRSEA